MDPSCKKDYCFHEADANSLFETYFSPHAPYSVIKDSTINVFRAFYKAFSTGMVTGRTVIDCSVGPIFHHLFSMKDFVQNITVLKLNYTSLNELEKWKNKEPDAFNWAHITEILHELKGNSDELEDKEEKLRGKIDKIFKWDPSEGDPANVLSLPKADIATSVVILEVISKDHEDYRRNLRKISNCIKPGGYFLLYAATNASYFNVGEDKFHLLPCDERFYKKVISEEGFEIKHFKKFERAVCTDSVDHDAMVFIIALKVNKPQDSNTS